MVQHEDPSWTRGSSFIRFGSFVSCSPEVFSGDKAVVELQQVSRTSVVLGN